MNSSNRRRRRNSDNRTYQTEFGPIDGRTRRLVGYLLMGVFGLMALGATSMWLCMDHGPLYDPISGLVMIGIVDLVLLGIPAIAFFGQKEEPEYAEYPEYAETRSPSAFENVNAGNYSDSPDSSDGYRETVTTRKSPTVQVMKTKQETKRKAKTKADADYSYGNEWPKRRRIDDGIK